MPTQPFTINTPQATLDDLRERLARTRWPDQVENAGWDYGTNLVYMQELTHYWQHTFDWRKQEALLNQFAQFRTEIDGFGVHFIHERGKGPDPLPLLLVHGWPDSFYRFYKIIPMLTDPASYGGDPQDSFDVIVPSLPGFGFSDRPQQRGMVDAAGLFARLMTDVLGYARFGAHGGDTGSLVCQAVAANHAGAVLGLHLTDIGYDGRAETLDPSSLGEAEQAYVAALASWWSEEGGYVTIQGTKPQTLAYGLNDSPVGLAAWIIQQFRTWSDCQGEIERRFTKDELLTNIMLYWTTETINSSIRWYYESMHAQWDTAEGNETGGWEEAAQQPQVPVGLALFPKDNPAPREMAARFFNVQHWTEMPRGGHFTALEEPELLVEDLRTFFRQLR